MKFKFAAACALTFGIFLLQGCEKLMEQAKQDALVDAMMSKTWYVAQYTEVNTVVTSEFSGYDFNFKSDHSVIAKKGTVSVTGDWGADINTKMLSASFNSGNPLSKLNGTWNVYYQDALGPKMNQVVNSKELKLFLRFR